MNRREFIPLVGGAVAAAWPMVAHGQQPAMPVVGFLSARTRAASGDLVEALHRGLKESGYVVSQNVQIEYRWAEGRYDRLPTLAHDLVRHQVAVIAAISGTPAALAAKAATTTIPIVFANGGDPIAAGLVTRLNRPASNITGATFFNLVLAGKRLGLMRELLPTATTMGILVNPSNPIGEPETRDAEAAARALGLQLHVVAASSESDIDAAFTTLLHRSTGALLVGSDPFLGDSKKIVELAAHHALPTIYPVREFTEAGGLMSYGASQNDTYRQAGIYAGKILQGARPADLPVMQPTKFDLVINLKTAKALGLDVPPTLLARADEVIE